MCPLPHTTAGMKAAVYHGPNKVEVADVPEPDPRPGTVQLKVGFNGSTSVGSDAGGCVEAGSVAVSETASFSDRHAANCSMIFPPTSAIMPRPNCAGLPVIDRSVTTTPAVRSPSSAKVRVTVAF